MKKIGIIVAMEKELEPILEYFADTEEVLNYAGYSFLGCKANNIDVILTCCGIGKTNATAATQIMIDRLGIDSIISTGVAGGMSDKLNTLDTVIADRTVFHDITPRFLENYQPHCAEYRADDKMLKTAVYVMPDAFVGLIISGDAYIDSAEKKAELVNAYSPLAVDMESASIGLCAYRNNIPFLSVRSISDSADEETTKDPDEFERKAAKQSAEFINRFIFANL